MADKVASEKQGYINGEQKYYLIEFMGKHPELRRGKFSASFSHKQAQKLWKEVTEQLNAIPGVVKEWKQWRTTWQDIRTSTKGKSAAIKKYTQGTGGGPSGQTLLQFEERVLTLIGTTAAEGHQTVKESTGNFDWGDDSENYETVYLDEYINASVLHVEENKENQDVNNNYKKQINTETVMTEEFPTTYNTSLKIPARNKKKDLDHISANYILIALST
ncbi:uncharacterized protein LOC111674147 [Orussus abietinus]|uniref:uncharacterized protein LOC111674147 n=1 Tax=Orussus abietinus TaxID=222816 RepID=UPI000C715E3D|nr:uncharacterized protein LOC111674147 [Orussus abietinus]